MLKECHGLDIFIAALNFPSASEARGRQGWSQVSTLITWELPLRESWVLNTIITSGLVGPFNHSVEQQRGKGLSLSTAEDPEKQPTEVPQYSIPTIPSCSLGSHQPLKDCLTTAQWTVILKIKIYSPLDKPVESYNKYLPCKLSA